jgi:hypothetical protein
LRREQLSQNLRKITGLVDLRFDDSGVLRTSNAISNQRSSSHARELIFSAIYGQHVVVIEDASSRLNVAFARVVPGKWKNEKSNSVPTFVIQIDFTDFGQLLGDHEAREAFNPGWALLHELDHVVSDTSDAAAPGETGECEANINQMRRECNLPERAEYYSVLSPLTEHSTFMTRLVRLAFEEPQTGANKKRRYWLSWDANVVGGLEHTQVAAAR